MSLDERLKAVRQWHAGPGPECGVARAVRLLDDDEARTLLDAVEDERRYPRAGLAQVLSELAEERGEPGLRVSRWSIGHHRRGDCRCHA